MQEKISFKKERDFSNLFNVSFQFLKQNFKSLIRCLLFITGPFILLAALVTTLYTSRIMNLTSIIQGGGTDGLSEIMSNVFSPMYFLTIFSAFLAHIMLAGTVYEFMQAYDEKGPGNITVNEIWNRVKRDFLMLAGTFFGIFAIALLAVMVFAFLIAGLMALSGVLGGIFAFLFLIGMFIIIFPLMYISTSVYLIRIRERNSFFEALRRAMYSMQNNFWWTWVIGLITYIIIAVIQALTALPQSIAGFLIGMNTMSSSAVTDYSVIFGIIGTITNFLSTLVSSIPMLVFGFHYLSLIEQKEGTGMMDKIDEIGSEHPAG